MQQITSLFKEMSFDIVWFFKNILKTFLSLLVSFGILSSNIAIISPQEVKTSEYFMQGDKSFATSPTSGNYWSVGFSKSIITPTDVLTNSDKYYLAGYGNNTHPTEVMDNTYVRTVYMADNSGRGGVIFAVIDAIGLSNKEVLEVREMVSDFTKANNIKSVNILCTHLHAGIDTQGLWGNLGLLQSGRNEKYNTYLKGLVADSIYAAFADRTKGQLLWGDILPENDIFSDNRKPYVYEKSITRIRFSPSGTESDKSDDLYICTMNAHPENMALNNTTVSADYPAYMGRYIAAHTGGIIQADGTVNGGADFMLINGAIGALINARGLGSIFGIIQNQIRLFESAPGGAQTNAEKLAADMQNLLGATGTKLINTLNALTPADLDSDGNLSSDKKTEIRKAFTQSYGETIGRFICEIDNQTEYDILPFINIRFNSITVPVDNYMLVLGAKVGLIDINSFKTGKLGLDTVITTEAGYLELGNSLKILLAPGELAPENAMGGFLSAQDSALGFDITRNTGFEIINPSITANKDVFRQKSLVFGLVNDEIGYIIPENDFYVHRFLPYFAQEGDRFGVGHYEETVSAGPKTAGIILDEWQKIYESTH